MTLSTLSPTEPAATLATLGAMLGPERPQQLAEWAIQLPNGIWWRKLSTRVADPNGTDPTVFHDRPHAEDEMVDVIGQAVTDFGATEQHYQPRLMVRSLVLAASGTVTRGAWRPADQTPQR